MEVKTQGGFGAGGVKLLPLPQDGRSGAYEYSQVSRFSIRKFRRTIQACYRKKVRKSR